MPSSSQYRAFATVVGIDTDSILDTAIDFVGQTLAPDDVFPNAALAAWCKDNASGEFSPEELFTADELSAWAEENGYTKE